MVLVHVKAHKAFVRKGDESSQRDFCPDERGLSQRVFPNINNGISQVVFRPDNLRVKLESFPSG